MDRRPISMDKIYPTRSRQIWSGAMMLDHLGEHAAAKAITDNIEECLISGPVTPDLGGTASTSDVGKAIAISFA